MYISFGHIYLIKSIIYVQSDEHGTFEHGRTVLYYAHSFRKGQMAEIDFTFAVNASPQLCCLRHFETRRLVFYGYICMILLIDRFDRFDDAVIDHWHWVDKRLNAIRNRSRCCHACVQRREKRQGDTDAISVWLRVFFMFSEDFWRDQISWEHAGTEMWFR